MRRGAVVLVAWGSWLGVWTAVQLLFLHTAFPERTIQWLMLGGASAAALVTGAALARLAGARRAPPDRQLIADQSAATATLAVGLAMALLGASFGLFLLLVGGATAALGLGGVLRENIARGRDARRGRIG